MTHDDRLYTEEFAERIKLFIDATHRLQRGDYDLDLPAAPQQDLHELGRALEDLAETLDASYRELEWVDRITARINAGLLLEEILETVYADFKDMIPYERIGLALLDESGERVVSHWASSEYPLLIKNGYSAPLAGSSLAKIIQTGQPRIINDLEAYLAAKPNSASTLLIVREGFRSSLTCPLIANGHPVGFLFFSSTRPNTYVNGHIRLFQRIAKHLSVVVDKGRLVSELAARKQAIEAQNAELKRLNELKNTFLGIAAHDMRSPLGVIEMAINFLMDPNIAPDPEESRAILADVSDQARHMLMLIDDLLDVTQIEAGTLELVPEFVNMTELVESAVARHHKLAARKDTQVVLEACPEGMLRGDPRRLRQVLDNLLSNAVKYSPGGSTIRVWVEQMPDVWRIAVQDEGPGITSEDRKRLFQTFARLSARPTGGERSTGLGLAITRRIVEAHGGIIDVDSIPGEGATFWFTLPA